MADAPLDPQAELELELELARARQKQGGGGVMSGAQELARSSGEGLVSIADLPEDLWTGSKNAIRKAGASLAAIPSELKNAWNTPSGQLPQNAPVTAQEDAPYEPVRSAYNSALPPDPNHPYVRMVGNVAGPAIVEAALSGGTSLATLPGMFNAARRATVTTAGTLGGGYAGEKIGEAVDGEGGGKLGRFFGSILGGGVAPGATTQAGWKTLNQLLTDEATPTRLAVADIAGVDPSMGLVGNKTAATLEDATAGVPFAGNPAYDKRRTQYSQMDALARDVAEQGRGGPSGGVINPSTMGQTARDTASQADAAARAAQDAALNPVYDQAGRDLPIYQAGEIDQLDTLRRGAQPVLRAPAERAISDANAARFDPLNPPKVVDPGLEAQLQRGLQQAQAQLSNARTSTAAQNAQAAIDAIQEQIARNRGSTLQEAIEQRNIVARPFDNAAPIDQRKIIPIKDAKTEAIANAVTRAGVPRSQFDAANAEYGRLADQRDLFAPLKDSAGQGEAYNALFTGTARQNVDRLNALSEHAPGPLKGLMANELETRVRGQGAGSQSASPETFTTGTASKWWKDLPEEARVLMAGPAGSPERVKMAALMETMNADARRPTRTLPGRGGNTIGAPQAMFQNPLGLSSLMSGALKASPAGGAGAGFLVGGPLGALVGAATPTLVAHGLGKAFTNPNFVRKVIRPGGVLDKTSLARLMAAALGAR